MDLLTLSNVVLSGTAVLTTAASAFIARRALAVSAEQSAAAQKSVQISHLAVEEQSVAAQKAAEISRLAIKEQSLAAQRSVEISSLAIEEQVRSEKRSRNLETLLHCQSAYKLIEQERFKYKYGDEESKVNFEKGQVGSLFRNYWTHKSDQMDYWLSGHVDYDTFLTWNISTLRHFVKNKEEPFYFINFTTGWAHYGRPYHQEMNPMFVRFTDAIQYHFRARTQVEQGAIYDVIAMIREMDKKNLITDDSGRQIRRYGSPENLDRFEQDLRELQNNMKDFLIRFLPDNYNIRDYGEGLKALHPLPEAMKRPTRASDV